MGLSRAVCHVRYPQPWKKMAVISSKPFAFVLLLTVAATGIGAQHLDIHRGPVMLVSTLNGTLYAISKHTGTVLWTLNDDPILSIESMSVSSPMFLPNPQDGSLYVFVDGKDVFEQLPVSIPKLAQLSPCQSSDGKIYNAHKRDEWIAVDPRSGAKLYTVSSAGVNSFCPADSNGEDAILLGKSTYIITVHDSNTRELRWNATYVEYSPYVYTDQSAHDMVHFCSTSDGSMVTLDSLTGQSLWKQTFGSPVAALYIWSEGRLQQLPITAVAQSALKHISSSTALAVRTRSTFIEAQDHVLQYSLFIGMSKLGVYAMPALVEENSIIPESSLPLLPPSLGEDKSPDDGKDKATAEEIGHIHLPIPSAVQVSHVETPPDSEDWFDGRWQTWTSAQKGKGRDSPHMHMLPRNPFEEYLLRSLAQRGSGPPPAAAQGASDSTAGFWLSSVLMSPFLSVLLSSITATLITSCLIVRLFHLSPNRPNASSHTGSTSPVTAGEASGGGGSSRHSSVPEKADSVKVVNESGVAMQGDVEVGKLVVFSEEVLGHGSQGTTVYRGEFDKRKVAVKRIVKNCVTLAEREVDLLRETDQHPNVIRYYCMEQDTNFHYIALELCQATLLEYVEDWRFDRSQMDELTLLQQTMTGLNHLHSLGIVHRDIKPKNVLISQKMSNGAVRAMISDFGLCRKLPSGQASYTARSGVTGTEGWIAPEILKQNGRVTCSVDIFSAGCLFYYTLTGGDHPFGPPFQRQGNIEAGTPKLSRLANRDDHQAFTASDLVTHMIAHQASHRPSGTQVLNHCLFWSKAKQMAFFQDVSDRIEKETPTSLVVQSLERNAQQVVRRDWMNTIGEELRQDLRKFRTYQGSSVRDLLRAMRNKKHHYRELPEHLQSSLGSLPDGFVDYFTGRFPQLLVHIYRSMDVVSHEKVFQVYYSH